MFSRIDEVAKLRSDLPARVFLSAGGLESGPMGRHEELSRHLAAKNFADLEQTFVAFPDEHHNSVVAAAISRGMRVLFARRSGRASVREQIDAPVSSVWAMIRDFGNVDWMGGVPAQVRGAGPGMVRLLGDPRSPVHEHLESIELVQAALRELDYRLDDDNFAWEPPE